jgi:hypothetical protein
LVGLAAGLLWVAEGVYISNIIQQQNVKTTDAIEIGRETGSPHGIFYSISNAN